MIKIFGHKIPDTDCVVSAITYAWYLSNIKQRPATAHILGNLNKETKYVLNYFGFNTPEILKEISNKDEIIIVDTNNPDELLENIHEAKLIEIIDHHQLKGSISTPTPISVMMRPMASTASLIYTLINPELHRITKEIAGIMLSGIISDTLEFRSPTTTKEDKEIAEALAKIAQIDIHELASEMFKAKSEISDLSVEEIILMDSKIFQIGSNKLRISVAETTNPQAILDRKVEIKESLIKHTKDNALSDTLFFIIDILNKVATSITYNDTTINLIKKAFGVEVNNNLAVLPGIVSRKKQIIPKIESII